MDSFLTSYDLSLAARGDTRRLWAERYLGLQKPQSAVEAYALHEVLCEELVKQTTAGTICDMRRCRLVPSGPAYRKAILDELTQNHTVTHSRWFYANASIDIPALSMDHTGLVHARTLAFAPECRTDDRMRAGGGRMIAFDLASLALTQGGIENPQVTAFHSRLLLRNDDRAELIFKQAVRSENPAFKLTDAIDAAGKTFADPLAPPAHGLFYAPLDAGFLPNGYHLNALLADQAMGRTGMRAVKLGRRLSAERQIFEFFERGIRPLADGASEPQAVIADTLPLDFAAGFDGAGGLVDQSQDRFSLAVMRVKVSHRGELITLGWGIPAKEEKERPVFSYFFYDGSAAERSSGQDVKVASLGSAVPVDKNIFTFYHSPILEMGGVSPATLGKALGLTVPESESADSPLDVARAKLALAKKGWDAYICKNDGPVLRRRKSWMTALARFYMQAAQKVIAMAQDARPLDGLGLKPFGSVGSYRPMQGFSKMEVAPEGPGLNSLEAGGLLR